MKWFECGSGIYKKKYPTLVVNEYRVNNNFKVKFMNIIIDVIIIMTKTTHTHKIYIYTDKYNYV